MKQSVLQKLKSKCKLAQKITSRIFDTQNDAYDNEPWYKQEFTRDQTETFLRLKEIGVFVIRKSETNVNCHVLSVRVPKYINSAEVSHYLLVKSSEGFCIRGLDKHFENLRALITHCSFMRDMIPVTLNVDFYRERTVRCDVKKDNFMMIFKSTTSLGSTTSSTSDFSEEFEFDLSTSSLNFFQ